MMNTINKWLPIATFVLLVALVLVGGNKSTGLLGGTTNYDAIDVTDGYYVDATQIIDGSGNYVGAFNGTTIGASGATDVGTLTFGGTVQSTTTLATTATLAASDLTSYSGMVMKPQSGSIAFTLPASTTMATFAPNVGDVRTFTFQNSTTTAGILMTFTGGTGNILKRFATSSVYEIVSDTDGGAFAVFTVVRAANPAGGVGDLIWNIQKNAD